MSLPSVVVWMALAISVVAALAYWDEEREAATALDDFTREQTVLAQTIAATLAGRLQRMAHEPAQNPAAEGPDDPVLEGLADVERPGSLMFLMHRPGLVGLETTQGRTVRSPALETAVESGLPSVRLARSEAAQLGLPARMAVAGLSRATPSGIYGVAVVATAKRERDRELRARWRLALGVTLGSALVLTFGGLALRTQRKELELEHDVERASLERERDERLVRADKLATMGALAVGIAHEVSTPLGVIAGRAEQLAGWVERDSRPSHAVQAIADQADRIGRIIRGFLALARGDSPALERVDPSDVARASLDLVEHRFAKASVRLSSHVEHGLPKIACEPQLFEQILVNLLLNACDACQPGGNVNLRVDGDGERVTFAVTDDGVGITAAEAARATEPFFTTKPIGKGSGLGLAIANELVKHHSGTLSIQPRQRDPHETGPGEPPMQTSKGTVACVVVPASPEVSRA